MGKLRSEPWLARPRSCGWFVTEQGPQVAHPCSSCYSPHLPHLDICWLCGPSFLWFVAIGSMEGRYTDSHLAFCSRDWLGHVHREETAFAGPQWGKAPPGWNAYLERCWGLFVLFRSALLISRG